MRFINPMSGVLVLCAMFSHLIASAAYTNAQSTVHLSVNSSAAAYAGNANADGLTPWQNAFLGRVLANGSLSIKSSSMRVIANVGGTTCSATFFYRVYRQGLTAPAFTAVTLGGPTTISAGVFQWNNANPINLMGNLTIFEQSIGGIGHCSIRRYTVDIGFAQSTKFVQCDRHVL